MLYTSLQWQLVQNLLSIATLSHEDTGCMGYFRTIGNPNATTGLQGRSMLCTGETTGKAPFDVTLCTYTPTRKRVITHLESLSATYSAYIVLGIMILLVSRIALKHRRAIDASYINKVDKEIGAEMETIMLTSIDMDNSRGKYIDHYSSSDI